MLRHAPAAYTRLFAPSASAGLSGFRHPPRPFVLRCRSLNNRQYSPGDCFQLDLYLLMPSTEALSTLVEAFGQLAREGIGPRRSRIELECVYLLDRNCQAAAKYSASEPPLSMAFVPSQVPVKNLRIDFLSPTEIKSEGAVSDTVPFHSLFRRILSRIIRLKALYSPQPLMLDSEPLLNEAKAIEIVESQLEHIAFSRTSKWSGQTHPLGGFVGYAQYRGQLESVLPFLEVACWTGVGRQTVWGKGEIALTVI